MNLPRRPNFPHLPLNASHTISRPTLAQLALLLPPPCRHAACWVDDRIRPKLKAGVEVITVRLEYLVFERSSPTLLQTSAIRPGQTRNLSGGLDKLRGEGLVCGAVHGEEELAGPQLLDEKGASEEVEVGEVFAARAHGTFASLRNFGSKKSALLISRDLSMTSCQALFTRVAELAISFGGRKRRMDSTSSYVLKTFAVANAGGPVALLLSGLLAAFLLAFWD